MKNRIVPLSAPSLQFQVVPRAAVTADLAAAVLEMEERFQLEFESVTVFTRDTLAALHATDGSQHLLREVRVLSRSDGAVDGCLEILTTIANRAAVDDADRRAYLDALLEVYRRMGCARAGFGSGAGEIVVGIEREGRILAEMLGLLRGAGDVRPHAKRIQFAGGLAVGLRGLSGHEYQGKVMVIDGAIASGATLIALMEHLRSTVRTFRIYAVHATEEGLRALVRYAASVSLDLELNVGHVTTGLNDHHYAIVEGQHQRLVVGDLGDMISPIAG